LGAAANFNLIKTKSMTSATPTTQCSSDPDSIDTVCYDASDNQKTLISASMTCKAAPNAPLWLKAACATSISPNPTEGFDIETGDLTELNKLKPDFEDMHWMVRVGNCMKSIDGVDNFMTLLQKSAIFTCQPDGTFKETR
jgi:hypothetical protein